MRSDNDKMIDALRGQIRAVRTTIQDDRYFSEKVCELDARIEALRKEREHLFLMRRDGEELIKDYQAKIQGIKRRKAVSATRPQIDKLLKLAKELKKLQDAM